MRLKGHDKNRLTPGHFRWVGQNFASGGVSYYQEELQLEYLMRLWYDEVEDHPASNVASNTREGATGVVGHYTQMVWATTRKIGCGFIRYRSPKKMFVQVIKRSFNGQ